MNQLLPLDLRATSVKGGVLKLHTTLNRMFEEVTLTVGEYVFFITLIAIGPLALFVTIAVLLGEVSFHSLVSLPNWRLGDPAHNFALGYADVIILSPFAETAVLIFTIKVFRILRSPEQCLPLFCGLVWGLLHARYHGSFIGLSAAWPFYCYTKVILIHEKPNLDAAWLLASAVHSLTNLFGLFFGAVLNAINNAF